MELHTVCFRGNYRRNEIFFLLIFFVSRSISNNFFYYQRTYRQTKKYRQKIHRRRLSIGDFIGNCFTNEMVVQIPTENSIGKSKDCGSYRTTQHNSHNTIQHNIIIQNRSIMIILYQLTLTIETILKEE
jgi:hypothetical protein